MLYTIILLSRTKTESQRSANFSALYLSVPNQDHTCTVPPWWQVAKIWVLLLCWHMHVISLSGDNSLLLVCARPVPPTSMYRMSVRQPSVRSWYSDTLFSDFS